MLDYAKADLDRGLPAGPLSGVPFLLKDLLVSYGGVPTNSGSRLFEGWTRPHDSEILKRWREAGLVVMGKQIHQNLDQVARPNLLLMGQLITLGSWAIQQVDRVEGLRLRWLVEWYP